MMTYTVAVPYSKIRLGRDRYTCGQNSAEVSELFDNITNIRTFSFLSFLSFTVAFAEQLARSAAILPECNTQLRSHEIRERRSIAEIDPVSHTTTLLLMQPLAQ